MADYIPSADPEFNNWQANFITYASTHLAELNLSEDEVASLTASQTNWQTAYSSHITAAAAAASARQNKDSIRAAHVTMLRSLAQRLQAHPNMTNAHRAALGLSVLESSKRSAIGIPTTRPIATVNNRDRLWHVINFVDETTPTRRAKPEGVMGCEIWMKLGEAPKNPDELTFLGLDTATPYTVDYQGEDAGKTVYYMLRWVNRRGEPGPWSQTVSAIVNG